ncbi:MAG: S-layer homology domain-containing protein [Oscillibacter sp.]|jgi:beta-N-acetylhexosaminidase|nr:S-layer homology domain-containing protein [Oscillibacter sp.]
MNFQYKVSHRLLSVFLTICLLAGIAPAAAAASNAVSFADVPENAWYAAAVEQITDAGVMMGNTHATFAPNGAMTRGMFVTALARLTGAETENWENTFPDVDADSAFAPSIAWAAETGIVGGYADGTFRPDKTLTRAQAAAMTANVLKLEGYVRGTAESAAQVYTDVTSIESWAQGGVAMVTRLGVMHGTASGAFMPNGTLTRAQSAQVLANLMTFLKEDGAVNDRAASLCAQMTTDEKIGQVLLMNFRNWKNAGAEKATGMTVLSDEVAGVIQKYHLGNIILFGENTVTTEDTARLTAALQATAKANGDLPLLIGIDQEGGTVTRLGQGTCLPGNMALGATNNISYAYDAGMILGSELAAEGINCDFAPDSDVNDNPANPVIGLRSFGSDPTSVSAMAMSLLSGLTDSGMIGCTKHFPGHGNTATDTHTGLAIVNKTKEQWQSVEAVPFQAMIASGVSMVMSAHIQYPNLDATQVVSKSSGEKVYLPATLSKTILTGVLRGELGFDGVICTDAMDMQAITDNFGKTDAVVMALNAGADLLCNPTDPTCLDEVSELEAIYAAIRTALKNGTLPQSQLDDAVTRVLKLKIESGILDAQTLSADAQAAKAASVVGCAAHRATERKIAEAAVTKYGDASPITLKAGEMVLFLVPYDNEANTVQFATNRLLKEKAIPAVTVKTACYNKAESVSEELSAQIEAADHVIVFSEMYGSTLNNPTHWLNVMPQAILTAVSSAAKIDAAVVSIGLPYDAVNYSGVPVYLAYGYKGMDANDAQTGILTAKYGPNISAGVGAALGAFTPSGVLPVNVG